jgi:hypothetical protein
MFFTNRKSEVLTNGFSLRFQPHVSDHPFNASLVFTDLLTTCQYMDKHQRRRSR